ARVAAVRRRGEIRRAVPRDVERTTRVAAAGVGAAAAGAQLAARHQRGPSAVLVQLASTIVTLASCSVSAPVVPVGDVRPQPAIVAGAPSAIAPAAAPVASARGGLVDGVA